MFSSVLVANRGEIAVRIFRTARRLGLRTIAVYSQADAGALHVRAADEAVPIGPAPARESYLVAERIMAAAKAAGAEAIHPGYGFLSERAEFAEAVAAAGLVFIGPPPSAIRAMGLKDGAKALMEKAGVPVVPGYHGAEQDPDFLAAEAARIGYPVLIKAVAGGGGKGMRRVAGPEGFADALAGARREAEASFGDPRVLVEKYVLSPRHVEIQVFGDSHGNVIHLGERDCSLQRRHQKVIEESPAPGMTPELRAIMGGAAVEAAKAVGYVGAGTVEFIADGSRGLRPDGFYFMEMNTRLQVEHPVTEAVTGQDLVEWQLRVAAGEKLPLTQDEVRLAGHAVEARLYAEDPERGFLPSTGRLYSLKFPAAEDGLRIDTGVDEGAEVTAFYDPMIAKVITHAPTREAALARLASALEATVVAGPRTNAAFLAALARADDFVAGRFDTGFIDRNLESLGATPQPPDRIALATAVHELLAEDARRTRLARGVADTAADPWSVTDGFEIAGLPRRVPCRLMVDGEPLDVVLLWQGTTCTLVVDGEPIARDAATHGVMPASAGSTPTVHVVRKGRQSIVSFADPFDVDLDHLDASDIIKAPMHGRVLAVFVTAGELVEKGARLAVVEAMKMEHTLVAPRAGRIADVAATVGAQVAEGAKLVMFAEQA